MKVGKVRKALAKLLQKSFPEHNGLALTWEPENIYPATGYWRTDPYVDCFRWEGFGRHYRQDGTYFTLVSLGSYETMTELCKAKKLIFSGYEVYADKEAK
jgi:hypothetical protein